MAQEIKNYIPHSVLIVDDDELILNLVSAQVESMGVKHVIACNNGHDAWNEIIKNDIGFDLILMDWKMPGLNGLGLFNRVRGIKEKSPQSILVISGFLSRDDFGLLEEYPCTDLLEKPFTKVSLEKKVKDLFEENTWYQEGENKLDAFVNLIEKADPKQAFGELQSLLNESVRPLPLAILAARRLRLHQYPREAAKIMEMILEKNSDSIMAIAEYAKILACMGQYEKARELLNISLKVSSESVERICLLGEVELSLHDPVAARKQFASALDIDEDHEKAKYGMTIANNLQKHRDNQPQEEGLPTNFASLMNIIGVNLVRTGEIQKGLEQYQGALAFISTPILIAKVNFNIGLAHFRAGNTNEAIKFLSLAAEVSQEDFPKAHAYLKKVKEGAPAGSLDGAETGFGTDMSYDGGMIVEEETGGNQSSVQADEGDDDDDDPFEEESLVI